mgnify:CR=1 FL=1
MNGNEPLHNPSSLERERKDVPEVPPETVPETAMSAPGESAKPYTVSGLTRLIKENVEKLNKIWLTGEISNLKCHTSGHVYLTIKDNENQINGVIWRHTAKNVALSLKDGIEVLVSGDLTIYGPQSKYQITIETIEPRGDGVLLVAFENLKKKLSGMGLFDPKHKKPLPPMPRKICLVTSPTGAAVQDILNVIARRFPKVHVLIFPVRVQGEGAAQEIAQAIRFINQSPALSDVEVMIVGRGGGSLEDLWAFNEEIVAHAIYESRIPIISAVGHEIDTTIADLVADRRALTPSESGELVVPRLDQICQSLEIKKRQLHVAFYNRFNLARSHLSRIATHRALTRPLDRIRQTQQRLDISSQRLKNSLERLLQKKRFYLAQISSKLFVKQPSIQVQRYRQHLESLSGRMEKIGRAHV